MLSQAYYQTFVVVELKKSIHLFYSYMQPFRAGPRRGNLCVCVLLRFTSLWFWLWLINESQAFGRGEERHQKELKNLSE